MTKSFIAIIVVFISSYSFTQKESIDSRIDKTKIARGVDKDKPVVRRTEKSTKEFTISKKAGENQVMHNDAYYLNEISKIDAHISSINLKVKKVQEDDSENASAVASGWFEDMSKIKERLKNKKSSLQQKLNH